MVLPESDGDTPVSSVPLTRREIRDLERLNGESVADDSSSVETEAEANAPEAVLAVVQDAASLVPELAVVPARSVLARSSRALRASRPLPTSAPTRPAKAPRKPKATARGIATLLVVPGLFLTIALPAYASAPNVVGPSTTHDQNLADAQTVDVVSFANQISVARDAYSATTPEELAAAKAAASAEAARVAAAEERAASSGGRFAVVGQQAVGDDYPWWDQLTDNNGGGLSPLRYYYRECVDFVAWRMNRDAGSYGAPFRWDWSNMASGSAYKWPSEWQRHGWMTSTTPVVGAVAAFPGGNHVAYVQSVNGDGTVSLEEYNWGNDHEYHTRTIPAGEVPIYLYPPA